MKKMIKYLYNTLTLRNNGNWYTDGVLCILMPNLFETTSKTANKMKESSEQLQSTYLDYLLSFDISKHIKVVDSDMVIAPLRCLDEPRFRATRILKTKTIEIHVQNELIEAIIGVYPNAEILGDKDNNVVVFLNEGERVAFLMPLRK